MCCKVCRFSDDCSSLLSKPEQDAAGIASASGSLQLHQQVHKKRLCSIYALVMLMSTINQKIYL